MPRDEHDVCCWHFEGRWSYLENSPLEGPSFRSYLSLSLSLSYSLARSLVPHPRPRSCSFFLGRFISVALRFSLSSPFSFVRIVHSYGGPRKLGNAGTRRRGRTIWSYISSRQLR
jgi:hypothetical protein